MTIRRFVVQLQTSEQNKFYVLVYDGNIVFCLGDKIINTVEQWRDQNNSTSVPGKPTIIDWYADFKRGRLVTDDAARFGRLNEAVDPESTNKYTTWFCPKKIAGDS